MKLMKSLYMDEEYWVCIERLAKQDGRSVNNFLVHILEEALQLPQRLGRERTADGVKVETVNS